MKKILFYYHHFGGLGHGKRVYSLCKAVKSLHPDYKLFVLNSGRPQPELAVERYAKVIDLPYFSAKEGLFSGLRSSAGVKATFRRRKRILSLLAERLKPQVAVFEHFPFGRGALKEELVVFITALKKQQTLIYSSVRDIIAVPLDNKELTALLELFNGVFVHSDPDMGFITAFKQTKALREKLMLTGRLFGVSPGEIESKEKARAALRIKDRKMVVVSVGGGIDGRDLLEKIIAIKHKLDAPKDTLFVLFAGPSMDGQDLALLTKKACADKGILLNRFKKDYLRYLSAADLVISMAGYNSVNDALLVDAPALIVPRTSDQEQQIRAKHFQCYFASHLGGMRSRLKLIDKINGLLNGKQKAKFDKYKGCDGFKKTACLLSVICNLEHLEIRLHTYCDCDRERWALKCRDEVLDYEVVRRVLKEASVLGVRTLDFTGGKSSAYPRFPAILKEAKSKGFLLSAPAKEEMRGHRSKLVIGANGEVSSCCSGTTQVLGNVYENSLVEMLSSDGYSSQMAQAKQKDIS